MSLSFDGRMWLMAGWHDGRLPSDGARNEVWSSTDGVNWLMVTKNAGWSPRLASGAVVFKDRMWIIGGTEDYYFGVTRASRTTSGPRQTARSGGKTGDSEWFTPTTLTLSQLTADFPLAFVHLTF
jgi:hypothetical protein